MKVRIKVQPTGLLNGAPWPEVGETLDAPAVVADDLIASGVAEAVKEPAAKVEKRPASKAGAETRKG